MSLIKSPRLGVNIDHVATLRQLRKTPYPDLLEAARLCEQAGAEQITVHLREDRRHIQDEDVKRLRSELKVPLNLEMAATDEMVRIAGRLRPDWCCLVPEKRKEITTEGGLDIGKGRKRIAAAVSRLKKAGIRVSLFVEPSVPVMHIASELGADAVELHTGRYCLAAQGAFKGRSEARAAEELERISRAARQGRALGLHVHAGHGFDYENVRKVAALEDAAREPLIEEYNIGHSIVCRAALVGMERAVREMISAILAP
ncbi:MAG: pyridoxine 5'-phosphate synthase [Oligoflexia bacterium]|nr:pyridoxine 5'-phosphate synthase [Oligoflexia bacterium]